MILVWPRNQNSRESGWHTYHARLVSGELPVENFYIHDPEQGSVYKLLSTRPEWTWRELDSFEKAIVFARMEAGLL